MNRDLIDYQENYFKQPYEKYQVGFRKRKLIEILNRYNHNNLLEVGCGLESIFLDFDSYEKLTIIEPGEMFYNKTKEDIKTIENQNVLIVKTLFQDSEIFFQNEIFDFILISCLLHEIPDHKIFFNTLKKISSTNTIIHINVPNANSFHRLLAFEMGIINSVFEMSKSNIQFQQLQVFDIDSLVDICENNGFQIVESGSYSFKPFTHSQMQEMIDNNLMTEKMLEGMYRMDKYLPNFGSEIYVNIKLK